MKKILMTLGMATVIAVAGSIVVAQSQEESAKKDDLIFASAEKATFKEVSPGVSKAAVWGDEEKGHMGHLPSSSRAWTTGCTRTRTIFGSLGSRAPTSTGTKRARSELRREISCGFRVEKSIGAAATRRRVRCSMKNHLANSTLCP